MLVKLSCVFLAALAYAQEATPPKPEPTAQELQAENATLRAYITQLEQFYGNSLSLLRVQHDAVVNACVGQPPKKPEAKSEK